MFIVRMTSNISRVTKALSHDFILGLGNRECDIFIKILSGEELTEDEESVADKMLSTLESQRRILNDSVRNCFGFTESSDKAVSVRSNNPEQ